MKIGFFGGCFNPPTFAHINLAKKALIEANLDKIIFVPVSDFYEKKELASADDRYNMLKIICEKLENIEVSDLELNINKKLFAIDVFKLIKKEYPNDDLYFIMGADNFINIMKWKDSEELIQNYKYIVFERENIDVEKYIDIILRENKEKVLLIKNPEYSSFSSSKYRNNAKKIEGIIPYDVLKYIEKNKLYN